MFTIRKRKAHYGTFDNKKQKTEVNVIMPAAKRTYKKAGARRPMYKRRNTALAYPNGKWWTPRAHITATKNNKWQHIWVELPASEFNQSGNPNNISISDIRTRIATQLGFTPTTYRVHSIRCWNSAGVGTTENTPKLKLRVNALTNNSTFANGPFMGEMNDNGELNSPAKLAFTWPHVQTQKVWGCTETSGVLADISTSLGKTVTVQIHVSYFGLEQTCSSDEINIE